MRILLAPLDWGLGHATRSLTLAKALESLGHEICIASNGGALHVMRQALPGRSWWELPSYEVTYSPTGQGFFLSMLRQWPRIRRAMAEEHHWLHHRGKAIGFDLIISDGRYGLWHEDKPSVLVTHQLALHPPIHWPWPELGLRVSEFLNRFALKKFSQIWVPDVAQAPGLAARLSHPKWSLKQTRYIGPLNRFAWDEAEDLLGPGERNPASAPNDAIPALDWLGIISGPEPQRQAFENELRRQLALASGTRVLVLGKPGFDNADQGPLRLGALNIYHHVDGKTLRTWLHSAKAIVTRSGYTTVMEMACLGLRPILMVPTPGQPEQEYLARELARGGWVATQNQTNLDLAAALPTLQSLPGLNHIIALNPSPGATREGLMTFLRHEIPSLI